MIVDKNNESIISSDISPSVDSIEKKLWKIQTTLESYKMSGALDEAWYLTLVTSVNKAIERKCHLFENQLMKKVKSVLDLNLKNIDTSITPLVDEQNVYPLAEVLENWNRFLEVIDSSYRDYFETLESEEFISVFSRKEFRYGEDDINDQSQRETILVSLGEWKDWNHDDYLKSQKSDYADCIESIRNRIAIIEENENWEVRDVFFDILNREQWNLLKFWDPDHSERRIIPKSQFSFGPGTYKEEDNNWADIPSYLKNRNNPLDEDSLLAAYWIQNGDELREIINLPYHTTGKVRDPDYELKHKNCQKLWKEIRWILKS